MATLARHGLSLDGEGFAWAGEQVLHVVDLDSSYAGASGRLMVESGFQLWDACDALSGDLESLASPLVSRNGSGQFWSDEVLARWPEADLATRAVLLQSVQITPVLRGHLLGAWAAATSVAMFDNGQALVATMAAPLSLQDAIADLTSPTRTYPGEELTQEQQQLWSASQRRLARHWSNHLGLSPLKGEPSVLTWCTFYSNPAILQTLHRWVR